MHGVDYLDTSFAVLDIHTTYVNAALKINGKTIVNQKIKPITKIDTTMQIKEIIHRCYLILGEWSPDEVYVMYHYDLDQRDIIIVINKIVGAILGWCIKYQRSFNEVKYENRR